MHTQQQFIDCALAQYTAEDIRPGDPYFIWEGAHHPTARHQGGRTKTPLTKHHHAIHNILQSDEVGQYSCFGWEKNELLKGPFVTEWFDLLDAHDYWISEGRREAALKLHSVKLADGRSAHAVKAAKARHAK